MTLQKFLLTLPSAIVPILMIVGYFRNSRRERLARKLFLEEVPKGDWDALAPSKQRKWMETLAAKHEAEAFVEDFNRRRKLKC